MQRSVDANWAPDRVLYTSITALRCAERIDPTEAWTPRHACLPAWDQYSLAVLLPV
jgi:hypothetical protein